MNEPIGLTIPPTEVEIAECMRWAADADCRIIRRLAFQRDAQRQRIAELEQNLRLTEADRNGLLNDRDAMVERSAELEAEIARREDMCAQALRIIDNRKALNGRHASRIAELEGVLRSLASFVGNGGYNADAVNPAKFEAKIRDGIDNLTRPLVNRIAELERRAVDAERRAEAAERRAHDLAIRLARLANMLPKCEIEAAFNPPTAEALIAAIHGDQSSNAGR